MSKVWSEISGGFVIVFLFVVVLCILSWTDNLYEEVEPVIEECKALDDKGIVISGKVVVFDYWGCEHVGNGSEGDTIAAGFEGLERYLGDMGGTHSDPELTVFVVKTTRLERKGYYRVTTVKKAKAFRGQHDVYVIAYPSLESLGSKRFVCNPPPPLKYLEHYYVGGGSYIPDVVGNKAEFISWLEGLPTESE